MTAIQKTGNGWEYGYFQAGTGKAQWHRMTLIERIRLRRRRRFMDDLAHLRGGMYG